MNTKIRLGLAGAGAGTVWSARSHLPALSASPDFELVAVCTTKPESAEAMRQKYGARLAFHDYAAMARSPDIDAVAVVVRVPAHYGPAQAALEAGKHVYTEWPLGRTTAEAEELAALARAKGVRTAAGLQGRLNPGVMYLKELVDTGYVGQVMSCHVSLTREGILARPASRTWQRDASLGANTLTIPTGHTLDALRFIVGDFERVASVVATQARQWLETESQILLDVTSPDNVLISGHLASGAVASVHCATIPWAGSGLRIEIFGREGTLVATGRDSPQFCDLKLQGARQGNALGDLDIPARLTTIPAGTPPGDPENVARMYVEFAKAIRGGPDNQPTFDTAVELHRLLDTVTQASTEGQALPMRR